MAAEQTTRLEPGTQVPDFSLPATDGKTYALSSFEGKPVAVVFLANHCPYVGAWEDRLIALAREYGDRVAFVGISPNDTQRFPKDSFEEMKRRVEENGYPFPYLYNEDGSAARDYGATRTPEVFLVDAERRLRYRGAIDSDWEEEGTVEPYLRAALDQLLAGETIALPETQPVGCTIKRKA